MVLFIAICESESMSVTPFSGRRYVGLVATKSRLSFAAAGAKHAQWLITADTRQAMLAQIEQAKGTLNARSTGRGGGEQKKKVRLSDLQAKKGFGMTCPNCGCEHLLDPEGPGWECYKTVQLPGETRRFKLCRICYSAQVPEERVCGKTERVFV